MSMDNKMDDNIRWMLINDMKNLTFIGKDIIATHNSKYILLHNLNLCTELVYTARNEKYGNGVECFAGHKTLHIFAFAEKTNNPRVFIINYPDFKLMSILKDNATHQIVCLEFVEPEYVVALSSFPACKIIVWCWRTERKLITYDTGIQSQTHILRASANQSAFCHSWDGKLCFWEIIPSYKSCLLQAKPIYKGSYNFVDFTWTNEDNIYSIDENGFIYSFTTDGLYTVVTREICSDRDINNSRHIINYKNGLIILGTNLQYLKKNKNEWVCSLIYELEFPIIKTISSLISNVLVCVTSIGDVVQLSIENDTAVCNRVSYWDRNIILFDVVNEDYIVTLNLDNVLCLRCSKSGELKCRLFIKEEIFDIRPCTIQPIIALSGGSDGMYGVVLIEASIEMKYINSICLSDKIIKNMLWSNDGTKMLSSTSDNFIFYLEIKNNSDIVVIHHIDISVEIKHLWLSTINEKYFLICTILTNEDISINNSDCLQCYDVCEKNVYKALAEKYDAILCLNESDILLAISKKSSTIDILMFFIEDENLILNKIKSIDIEMKIFGMKIRNNSDLIAAWNTNSVQLLKVLPSYTAETRINLFHDSDVGIKEAKSDQNGHFIMSLNQSNHFIVSNTMKNRKLYCEIVRKYNKINMIRGNILQNVFKTKEIWLLQTLKRAKSIENVEWSDKRQDVSQMNITLKDEIKEIIMENSILLSSYQLPLTSFIMNTKVHEAYKKNIVIECENKRQSILDKIMAQNKVSDWIKEYCWDSMKVIGTELNSIFTNKHIENYSLSLSDVECKSRTIPMDILKSIEILQIENLIQNFDASQSVGHSDPKIINTTEPSIYSQILLHSFLQLNFFTHKTMKTTQRLRQSFNEEFDKIMMLKQEELKSAKKNSDRLQLIISELSILRKLKGNREEIAYKLDIPQLAHEEIPNKLITIDPDELTLLPYVSPSEMIPSSTEKNEINPFYKETLKEMMDGTLDKLEHEEIKKEIPKPKCMTEKSSEDLNEMDIMEIDEWNNKIKSQKAQRKQYGFILKNEFQELSAMFNENINKFNKHHSKLYSMKLKIESDIAQEELKLMLLRVNKLDQIEAAEKEKELELDILGVEMEQDRAYADLSEIQTQLSECHGSRDVITARNRVLDKNFRSNFPDVSAIVVDLCFKLFQKRSKWQSKIPTTTGVLTKMAQACLTKEVPELLHADSYKYLKGIDQLDMISNMPPLMDEIVWNNMCRLRRIKIDNEIKERAVRVEMSDLESAYATCQKRITMLRGFQQKLKADLYSHHMFMENQTKNTKLQLVIKSGLVKIATTGHLEDFDGAILIKREEIDAINCQIKKAEQIKFKAVQATAGFKKYILAKEWEHATLKIKVKQLETDLYYFERIKVTKEVQKYLQDRAIQKYSKQDIDNKLEITKSHFHKQLFYQIQNTEELEMKLGYIQANIQTVNNKIEKLKNDILKKREMIDSPNNEEKKQLIIKRMKAMVWRNKLVNEVQKQHTTIILLQTELELQRLRTYPTLTAYQNNH